MGTLTDTESIDTLIRQRVDEILSQRLEEKLAELKEYCAAATFLQIARDADVSLFV